MLSLYDEFSGVGGTSKGASCVPGVEVTDAANHDPHAIESHALNFPNARHYEADVTKLVMEKMPRADIFTASPVCPPWTDANGIRRDFDKVNAQQTLFGDADEADDEALRERKENYRRARLLMNEVPRYLRAMSDRGEPVLAGLVENVIQCRMWSEWDRWISEFHKLEYETRLIAFNSMHARPVRSPKAPQSRDRLFLGYWHRSLGRRPDWDKWLRPKAWCSGCDEIVNAIQAFKRPGADMGRYKAQYVYRCPKVECRHVEVFPDVLPALSAIDPAKTGVRIGDRVARGMPDLKAATRDRIRTGVGRYWAPLLCPAGGTWRKHATRLADPAPARTTRESDGVAFPPLLVPVEGRPGKVAAPAMLPMRTQTTRNETGFAVLPFITPLRGGGDKGQALPTTVPARTVTASGNHHGLALAPPKLTAWAQQMLVPYYGSAVSAIPASGPSGALTTRDRYGVAEPVSLDVPEIDVDDVLFRMLEDYEIGRLMAFEDSFLLAAKSKRIRTRLYGNAVTPPVAEVIVSALVEAITGESLEVPS